MTIEQLIDQIVDALSANGRYQRHAKLFSEDLDFAFEVVLTGPKDADGLVTVHHVSMESMAAARRSVRALTTFLARSGSRRPFVLMAVTQSTSPQDAASLHAFLEEIRDLCRVIEVPYAEASLSTDATELRNWLRPLLPIELPTALASRQSAEQRLLDAVKGSKTLSGDSLTRKLLKAATTTSKDVETTMTQSITAIAQAACEVPHD